MIRELGSPQHHSGFTNTPAQPRGERRFVDKKGKRYTEIESEVQNGWIGYSAVVPLLEQSEDSAVYEWLKYGARIAQDLAIDTGTYS